ncbi:MBL fold metallo-hydrolase [Myxococcota bacterium]|nr:MBL fold metallo-hydrolase [Myxococcota bacterium]
MIGASIGLALGGAAAAGLWALSRPPKKPSAGDQRLHAIAKDVWLYRGYFSNSAVFVLPSRVVVVDSQVSPRAGAHLASEIAKVTPLPVTHVINTHYHGDHTGGNAAFPGAEIIASDDTRRFVHERDAERVEYADTFGLAFADVHPTIPPTRTFTGRLELELDGEKLEVVQLGRVETPDACVVIWPSHRVVACGDGVATHDYPYLGVPFLDEGLRDDGSWLGFLASLRRLRPLHLLPGHGPALSGEETVDARLALLEALMRDLLDAVRAELASGTPIPELVAKVDAKLAHYPRRRDLVEHTVSQRFAIYRCVNNLTPGREGQGWWHDLRPSVIVRAPREVATVAFAALTRDPATARARLLDEVRRLVPRGRPLAITLLERWTEAHDDDAEALGLLADVLFDGARGITVKVDATEYIALATKTARRALAIDPSETLANLVLGCAEVFGGMVLAQPMDGAIAKLERAVASGTLTAGQHLRACFFLGRAHQVEGRPADSDRWYRAMLPAPARFLYPLVRARIRAYP